MLDGREQRVSCAANRGIDASQVGTNGRGGQIHYGSSSRLQRRNVSHVENFNVAFARAVGQIVTGQGRVKATRHEGGTVHGCFIGLGAAIVWREQLGRAVGTFADVGNPHVAGAQENLEVKNIVRVGSAAETDLDGLAVNEVSVDQGDQRVVVALSAEVGNEQAVANAVTIQGQLSGASTAQSALHRLRSARKTQTDHCRSNAQC